MTATCRFRRFAAAATVFFLAAATAFSASPFFLVETKSHASFGPFTMYDGARVRVAGTLYSLSVAGDRISFGGVPGGPYGPYQAVNGRIMRIGDSMYSFFWKNAVRTASAAPAPAPEKPIAEFDPIPPMPEMIEVTEPESRHVEPLDLPALPDATKPPSWSVWAAPIDYTPFKWKIETAKGNEADYKRASLGAGLAVNSWFSSLRLSTGGKSDDIVKKGMGVTSSSLSDGTGFALEAGYKRPFISENGWVASGGIYARLRQDKADLTTRSLVHTSETDTNNVTSIKSTYRKRTSSVKLTEFCLGLDIDVAYVTDIWSAYMGVLIQPLSSLDVSGSLPYGDDNLKLDASHDDPLALHAGGWYEMDAGWRITADVVFGMETLLRVGVWHDF